MKKTFILLSVLSLGSFSSLTCLANTASLDQYEVKYCSPVTETRTTTEYKNQSAFTVLLDNGQLFSWCKTYLWGGENIHAPTVPEGRKVKEIFSSQNAFTALLDNGTILCWGGSDVVAPFIAPERKVCSVASNKKDFVAILDNGTAVAWGPLELPQTLPDEINKFYQDHPPIVDQYGYPEYPQLLESLADQVKAAPTYGLKELPPSLLEAEDQNKQVVSITSSDEAFAAVVADPATSLQTIISWGKHEDSGQETTGDELNATIEIPAGVKVTSIAANRDAFAALLDNGTIKVWGDKSFAGEAPQLPSDKKVVSLAATDFAFTALFADGTIQSWGHQQDGGKTPTLPAGSTVTKIFATEGDFAALLSGGENDGNILSWGAFSTSDVFSGNSKLIKTVGSSIWNYIGWKSSHSSVKSVVANTTSFAAILDDGSVIAWGLPQDGGATPSFLLTTQKAVSITPCGASFTALFADGSIQSWGGWGGTAFGGTTPSNLPYFHRVKSLTSDYNTYMAILDDGSLFSWGGDGNTECPEGQLIQLPEKTKALWMASPFEKHVLKASSEN